MLDQSQLRSIQSRSEDPRIKANNALIRKLQGLIENDGMPKKKAPSKRKTVAPPTNETCTCTSRVVDGKTWKVLDLECFDHGQFSKREHPGHERNYDLSKHPYAE